ncbi:MAG: glycosyltransferase family 2 protein [Candidatus Adlerbacteria bacterium]|nr:glycosyltransferase family 2 protein [Candidatus Adlerbacteria bacterium]
MLNTPVAFIIFNRPEKTARVFEAIRQARPKQLFIIADGPRNEAERKRTDATRAMTENVDWECEVQRRYAPENLSVKKGPPTGISWVFEHVDRAIFLEDDCLPDPTFFPYCEELLEKYKDDERVMQISGDNFQRGNAGYNCPESYYFSVTANLWGWATWRRAWQKYDERPMEAWPSVKKQGLLRDVFPDAAVRERWEILFERNWAGKADTWEGPWLFACNINRGLCINPKTNLVSNIGIDHEAAHWREGLSMEDEFANLPTTPLSFPLEHPPVLLANTQADDYSSKTQHNINRYFSQQWRWFLRSRFPRAYAQIKRTLSRR